MQSRRLTTFSIALTLAASLLVEKSAHAQGWLADRRYNEGIGIKVGDFELHPAIGGEVGFDSNWFNRTYNTGYANSNPVPAGIFRITPSLYLSTLQAQRKEGDQNAEPPKVTFRLGASATYRAFIGDQEILNQNGINGLSADLNGRVDVLPQRPFSFGLQAGYDRTINPNTSGNTFQNFNQNVLNAGADFTLKPGGGTLDWKFGYNGNFTFFDAGTATPFENFQNTFFTRGNWRFGPKTSLIYDGNVALINYQQQAIAINGLMNSTPVRSRLGLNGLIGPRFALLAFAGYGGSFVDTGGNPAIQQYDSVIGQLEGRFFLTANPAAEQDPNAVGLSVSALSIGYARDFAQSYLGSFYGSDKGYLKFSWFFGGRALISLEGAGSAREYPTVFINPAGNTNPANMTVAHASFVDPFIEATLFAEYRFSNTLGLNTTLRYGEEISSVALPADNAGGLYHMAFRRFEAYLGFRWFM
ncbi:MAG TPA: hypothetical protein VLM85_13950 [Polyangiaceae bacterium]|nr:hypothetical protein [Polyangiaceae bacterium]